MSDLPSMEAVLAGVAILIVDDDLDTLSLLSTMLRKRGAEVRGASSTEAALAVAATWRPDAVLCDLHLPGADGYALIAQLRGMEGRERVPVVAMSASHPTVERERALQAGFAMYVEKPARLDEVTAAVLHVLA